MSNPVLNFGEFININESHFPNKTSLGILGPFIDGVVKIKIPHTGENNRISHRETPEGHNLSYGDSTISMPKKCMKKTNFGDFDILKVDTSMNWFDVKENSLAFDDFLENYISSEIAGAKSNPSVGEDIELIMDMLGVDCSVAEITEIDENLYEADLDNGMQVELDRKSKDDLFKSIRVYKDANDIHPAFTLKKNGGKFGCKYTTDKGSHATSHDKIQGIKSDPVDQYMLSIVMGKDAEEHQKNLVDHLLKMLKYHSRSDESSVDERKIREKSEIDNLMNVLKNTIPESHIEEMYTHARSNFSSK